MSEFACGQCGMLVGEANVFHPFLYCELFKLGVMNPARFLADQRFIPDPAHWGKDAPSRQMAADGKRRMLVPRRQTFSY